MNPRLARKLIDKGAIRQGTEFEAYYRAPSLSCAQSARILERFVVQGARVSADGNAVVLEAVGGCSPLPQRFDSKDIVTIDGMSAQRFCGIWGLAYSGNDVAQGKRRGRRPKKLVEEMAAAAALAAEIAANSPPPAVVEIVPPPPVCTLRIAKPDGETSPEMRALLAAILAPYDKTDKPLRSLKAGHVDWLDASMMATPRASVPDRDAKAKPSIDAWLDAGGVIEFASKRDQTMFAVRYGDFIEA